MSETKPTEEELIERAKKALSRCNWEIGECAAQWTERYAKGRTDADFGALIGLSGDQVYQRRRVWERFHEVYQEYDSLRWSHFYAALNWDDARDCLGWADDVHATVAEMKAWRRAQHGEDLTQSSEEPPFEVGAAGEMLTVETGFVQEPGDMLAGRISNGGKHPRSEQGQLATAAVARESDRTEESPYAPFGKGARGNMREEKSPAAAPPPEQVIKRMTSALERIDAALTPEVLESFPNAPIKVQQRFLTAMENLISKTSGLR